MVIVSLETVGCLHTTETDGASGYTTAVHCVLPVRLASVLQITSRLSVGNMFHIVQKAAQANAQNCTLVNGK